MQIVKSFYARTEEDIQAVVDTVKGLNTVVHPCKIDVASVQFTNVTWSSIKEVEKHLNQCKEANFIPWVTIWHLN